MKKFIGICLLCGFTIITHAQLLKKIKDKVNKGIDKKIDKAVGTEKPTTETEKKENAASDQYSDVTENNERPIFVDKAPDNGRMVLQLKKDDLFWGGYIQLKGQPKKTAANAVILDSIAARVGSFYTKGEISSYAIYVDGQRFLNDSSAIPLRPNFISYDVNKTPFFISTEGKVGTPDPMAAVAAVQAKGNKPLTKEDEAEFAKTLGGQTIQPTFTFKYNGKTYGPFEGTGEKLLVLKSMTDGKPTEKFYGFGWQMVKVSEKQMVAQGLLQTEKKLLHIKDYVITTLMPSYPAGIMAFAQGVNNHSFSNGKTVAVVKIAGIADGLMNLYTADNKYYSEVYGTDSGHVVSIVKLKDITQADNTTEAYIDYTIKLTYPVNITKKNLLVASNPAKSVLYKQHTLYYADGTKETIDNVGDAQIINFNGKDYIVWFEMMKNAGGHQVYVCQKELK
ncbi:hypothetical protein [Ferruginibacter sp. SUN106]|uniref:hypothetical protein n=1 Tax=Ferruginibacter sp. SUN106 TaxID=2978348 RepID=UPI003D366A71